MLFVNLTDGQLFFVVVVLYGVLFVGFIVMIIGKVRDRKRGKK